MRGSETPIEIIKDKARAGSTSLVLALIGAPNSGKTTLYNWLTSSNYRVVNYPGSTVDYAVGRSAARMGEAFQVIDTPGTYSLFPRSEDEEVTCKVLFGPTRVGMVTHVGVVVDGTQLQRQLLLARQVKQTGLPMVIVVTMSDLLQKANLSLDLAILRAEFNCPVVLFEGLLGQGLPNIAEAVRAMKGRDGSEVNADIIRAKPWTDAQFAQETDQVRQLVSRAFAEGGQSKAESMFATTRKLDRVLLHPVAGIISFLVIMSLLFTSIYTLASPLMDWTDGAFSWAGEAVVGMSPGFWLTEFLGNGIIKGAGAVLVFVPQIFILFLGIGVLESSGYLARAATLVDRPFAWLGLSGRSFVPLLSGFACAVPAMMASRNLSSKRERWIVNFIIPLMTCSARLPVYALLLGFLFAGEAAWKPGLALAALYVLTLIVGALAAGILNRILPRKGKSFFMLDLPLYRRPRPSVIIRQSLKRTESYIRRAGPVILVFSMLVWVGSSYPTAENSYLQQVGQTIEPVFKPMGVDWRVGVGILSAFAAREVFVSTMAIIFSVTGPEDLQEEGLLAAMSDAKFPDGAPIFTAASVVGLIVFFMIALQCMSTVAVSVKENGSWKYALTQLIAFNVLGYISAVLVVQLLS